MITNPEDTAPATSPTTAADAISREAAMAALCHRCARPKEYSPARAIEGSRRLWHFETDSSDFKWSCDAQVLATLPAIQSTSRTYHCSCGSACTAEEYIDHYFNKGHDRGEGERAATNGAAIAPQTCAECGHDDQSKAARMYGCSEDVEGGYCNCQNLFHRKRPAENVFPARAGEGVEIVRRIKGWIVSRHHDLTDEDAEDLMFCLIAGRATRINQCHVALHGKCKRCGLPVEQWDSQPSDVCPVAALTNQGDKK